MSQALANKSICQYDPESLEVVLELWFIKINARPSVSAGGMAAAGKSDTSSVNSLVSTTEL